MKNKIDLLRNNLYKHTFISTDDIQKLYGDVSMRYIYMLIKQLVNEGVLIKVDSDKYKVIQKKPFVYSSSALSAEMKECIGSKYPLVDYCVFDSGIFNNFLNHQISMNIVFVEVEKDVEKAVYEYLREEYVNVLFKPDLEQFRLYAESGTVIVRQLITKSPLGDNYSITLEKLLVDVFVDKLLRILINESEYNNFTNNCFSNYLINKRRILAYSSRRNCRDKIKKYYFDNFNINLGDNK